MVDFVLIQGQMQIRVEAKLRGVREGMTGPGTFELQNGTKFFEYYDAAEGEMVEGHEDQLKATRRGAAKDRPGEPMLVLTYIYVLTLW